MDRKAMYEMETEKVSHFYQNSVQHSSIEPSFAADPDDWWGPIPWSECKRNRNFSSRQSKLNQKCSTKTCLAKEEIDNKTRVRLQNPWNNFQSSRSSHSRMWSSIFSNDAGNENQMGKTEKRNNLRLGGMVLQYEAAPTLDYDQTNKHQTAI